MFYMLSIPISYIQSAEGLSLRTVMCRRVNYLKRQLEFIRPRNIRQRGLCIWDILNIEFLISELDCLYRLVSNSVICNSKLQIIKDSWKRYQVRSSDHADELFGRNVRRKANYERRFKQFERELSICERPDVRRAYNQLRIEKGILEEASRQNYANRKSDLNARLTLECELRIQEGWYPIFNTLTVENEYYEKVFAVGSKVWSDYVRLFDRAVSIASFGSVRGGIGKDYHSYFAVVEEGSETGRLHIHVLHFCKALPKGFYDPNRACGKAVRREIDSYKRFWKWGKSAPIAVRMCLTDCYGKLGFRWPEVMVEEGKYIGIPIKSPGATVGYVSKYLDKPVSKSERKVYPWRVRISRKLGLIPVSKLCERLSLKQLRLLVTSPLISGLKMMGKRLPRTSLKLLASKTYLTCLRSLRSCQNIYRILKDVKPASTLCERVRSQLTMNIYHQNRRSIINTNRLVSADTVVFNKIQKVCDEVCMEVYGRLKPINYLNVLGG